MPDIGIFSQGNRSGHDNSLTSPAYKFIPLNVSDKYITS